MANKKRNLEMESPLFVQVVGTSNPWNIKYTPLFTQYEKVKCNNEFSSISSRAELPKCLNDIENTIVDVFQSQMLEVNNNDDWHEDVKNDNPDVDFVVDIDEDSDDGIKAADDVIAFNDGIMHHFDIIKWFEASMEENEVIGKSFCDSGDYTVEDVAVGLNKILRLHNASLSFENELMQFLVKIAPHLKWPIVERKGKIKSNIRSFGRDIDKDYIAFDVCVNGCMAFVGEDVENLKYCGKCNAPRFYDCTHRSCVERTLIDCPHKISTLRSRKESYYFPMLSTFEQLVSFEKFREEIYRFERIGNYYRVNGVYKDVGD